MASVPSAPIGTEFTPQQYPFVTEETRQRLAQEKLRLQRDESASVPAADLHRQERFIFRAKPGTARMIYHNLDVPPEPGITHYERMRYLWERRQIEAAGLGPDSDPKVMAKAVAEAEAKITDIAWRNGGNLLVFHRVRRANECYFPTNDEVLAAYVRGLMKAKRGMFEHVYEVSGHARIVVGDTAFPDTESGMRMAKDYAREQGIDEIKLVKE